MSPWENLAVSTLTDANRCTLLVFPRVQKHIHHRKTLEGEGYFHWRKSSSDANTSSLYLHVWDTISVAVCADSSCMLVANSNVSHALNFATKCFLSATFYQIAMCASLKLGRRLHYMQNTCRCSQDFYFWQLLWIHCWLSSGLDNAKNKKET